MAVDALTADGGTTETNSLDRIRRYRRLMYGSIAVAVVGLLAGSLVDQLAVGLAIYLLGFTGAIACKRGGDVDVFDERDRELDALAGAYTLTAFGYAFAIGWPVAVVLESAGHVTIPPELFGVAVGYAALFLGFVVVSIALRLRR